MSNTLLSAENIHKSFRDGTRTLDVLKGCSLTIDKGEYISIIGASGSGKSTLLHILGALDTATSGEVTFDGVKYSSLNQGELSSVRQTRIGFIYQFHHLLPEFTALENVFIPGMINRQKTAYVIQRATDLLTKVGLADRLHHRPSKLSGGEQQRVALARAVMNNPSLVLADEPTGDLDQKTGSEVMNFVLGQTVGEGKSLVIVTHDPAIAARAKRTFRLDSGVLRPA